MNQEGAAAMQGGHKKKNIFIILLPWAILLIAEVFYAHQYFLRVSISSFTSYLTAGLHMRAETIVTIAASFYYAYMAVQLFSGALISRFGSKTMLTLATLLCTAGSFMFTFSHHNYMAEVARGFMGAGAAFAFVNTLFLARTWFSDNAFGLINGATSAIGTVGAMLGTTALLELVNTKGVREVMFVISFVSLVLTIIVWIFVRDTERVKVEREVVSKNPLLSMIVKEVVGTLRKRAVWLNGLFAGCIYVIVNTFTSLMCTPYYHTLYGKLDAYIQFTPTFMFGGIAVGAILFFWLANVTKRPVLLIRLAAILFTIFSIIILYFKLPEPLLAVMLFLTGVLIGSAVLTFVIVTRWVKGSGAASAIAITNVLQMGVGALLMPIMGKILDLHVHELAEIHKVPFSVSDYRTAFYFIVASGFLAIVISFLIRLPSAEEAEAF